jgi:hypothetical protein
MIEDGGVLGIVDLQDQNRLRRDGLYHNHYLS